MNLHRLARPLVALGLALLLAIAGAAVALAAVEPLTRDCAISQLAEHLGFQDAPRCVVTSFGEVSAQAQNPTLLITAAPRVVQPGQDIVLTVSSRNLIRDRFLAAGQGGYYLESATLTGGITRGHVHVACRSLGVNAAPAPDRQPSFRAVEDGGGGAGVSSFTVTLPGLLTAGPATCAAWSGDGSHRIPMMQFANQIPALDTADLQVTGSRAEGRARGDGL